MQTVKKDNRGRIIYCRNCNYCGKYYEGRGKYFCCLPCANLSEYPKKKRSISIKKFHKNNPNTIGFKKNHICFLTKESGKKISKTLIKNGSLRGENSPNWKGGISTPRDRLYKSWRWKEWREKIFNRDNYTCQKCGNRGGNGKKVILHPHHCIITFSIIFNSLKEWVGIDNLYESALKFEPLWDINNGQTLCIKCHRKIHSKKS